MNIRKENTRMNAVDEFIRLAETWGAALEAGDSETANALHERLRSLFGQISRLKHEADLFDHVDRANDAACFCIASFVKERDQPLAIKLYERLAKSSQPLIAMLAEHILRELAAEKAQGGGGVEG